MDWQIMMIEQKWEIVQEAYLDLPHWLRRTRMAGELIDPWQK